MVVEEEVVAMEEDMVVEEVVVDMEDTELPGCFIHLLHFEDSTIQ